MLIICIQIRLNFTYTIQLKLRFGRGVQVQERRTHHYFSHSDTLPHFSLTFVYCGSLLFNCSNCSFLQAGLGDSKFVDAVKNILIETGVYFQAQDDYIDCFGSESITGKYGTDIEDGKCTWLLATALEKGTPEQIEVLKVKHSQDHDWRKYIQNFSSKIVNNQNV